jgi:hypothetical protein
MANNDDVQLPSSSDGYRLLGEIGSGAFAIVYRAEVIDTKRQVAIKKINLNVSCAPQFTRCPFKTSAIAHDVQLVSPLCALVSAR